MATIEIGPELAEGSTVSFSLRFPEYVQRYAISSEALVDLERAKDYSDADLLIFFHKHVKPIIQVAERKHGTASRNAVILLETADFA